MGFTLRELLYETSYQNLIMLSAALPSYKSTESGTKHKHHNHIDAEDVRNRDNVKAILFE